MRILVLFAHPVETSFGAAPHAKLVEVLRAKGTQGRRLRSQRRGLRPGDVAAGPDRLSQCRGQSAPASPPTSTGCSPPRRSCSRSRSGTWASPRSSRDSSTRSSCPGVSFTLGEDGSYNPCLHNIKRLGVVCTYGGSRLLTFFMGDPPRRFLTRSMRRICAPGARCDYLAHYDMDHTTAGAARGVPQEGRGEVLDLVSGDGAAGSLRPRRFLALDGPAMLRSVRPRRNP